MFAEVLMTDGQLSSKHPRYDHC